MTALSAERNTPTREGADYSFPVAASTTCYAGGIAAMIASSTGVGNVKPGATATNLKGVGVFAETVVNAGSAGAVRAKVRKGLFQFGNSASTDAIALKDVGATCYIVDDQTVALTDGSSSRSAAGIIRDVDANGVWVEFQ